jgi:hypothetical protein
VYGFRVDVGGDGISSHSMGLKSRLLIVDVKLHVAQNYVHYG